jgi:hypothetical protein
VAGEAESLWSPAAPLLFLSLGSARRCETPGLTGARCTWGEAVEAWEIRRRGEAMVA